MQMDTTDPEKKSSLDAAWGDLQCCFGLRGCRVSAEQVSPSTAAALAKYGIAERTARHIQAEVVEKRLREDVAPSFWAHFANADRLDSEEARCHRFVKAVSYLHASYVNMKQVVTKMAGLGVECTAYGETSYPGLFHLTLKGTLHSQMPPDFETLVEAFYSRSFHVFCARQEEEQAKKERATKLDDSANSAEDEMDDSTVGAMECPGCRSERESCICPTLLSQFDDVNAMLLQMDLLERLTSHCLTRIVHARIDRHVQDTCKGSFTISHLDSLEEWLDAVVVRFMRLLYSSLAGVGMDDCLLPGVLQSFRRRLCNHLYETYTRTRIDQLFNVIIEFPESAPALEDVRECLEKTDLRQYLTANLKAVLQRKLLHLGVSTTDILTAYISAIKSLRVLDPSGVILEIVCEPVRRYLRTREDTVRCIVQSLIDDSSSELADELTKNEGLFLEESFEDDEDKMENWENWMPDPVDADSRKTSSSRRSADIISMLVNIYGSKELFVNEYRSLLSNRLLSHFSYETDREIRNLELLKLRFGEAPLHQCEVMLKDIGDSKRINSNLHSAKADSSDATANVGNEENVVVNATANAANRELNEQPFPVNAIILSAQFWPQFKEDTLQLPPEVTRCLDVYTKAFEAMKGNRTLVWKNHLGFANIDLEIGEKKINLTVSPVHAAIIYQFQIKAEWTSEELAHTLSIPVSTLRRRITYWQSQGLLREVSTDRFCLIEEGPMRRMSGNGGCDVADADDESESVTRTSKDQRNEELQVFWSYISNMLINFESLPLDRIYTMLKMFAMAPGGGEGGGGGSGGAGECDIEEVRGFLDRKVRAHELVFSGGQYRLPKS